MSQQELKNMNDIKNELSLKEILELNRSKLESIVFSFTNPGLE